MTVLLLVACGASGEVLVPSTPPPPPVELTQSEPEVVKSEGTVTDIHVPTRSFLLASPEQRYVCVLPADGVVELDGRVASLADLPATVTAAVEGKLIHRDVLVVRHVRVGAAAPVAVPAPATPEPAPAAPAPVEAPPPDPAPPADAAPQ